MGVHPANQDGRIPDVAIRFTLIIKTHHRQVRRDLRQAWFEQRSERLRNKQFHANLTYGRATVIN
jgi:hypothetical protein